MVSAHHSEPRRAELKKPLMLALHGKHLSSPMHSPFLISEDVSIEARGTPEGRLCCDVVAAALVDMAEGRGREARRTAEAFFFEPDPRCDNQPRADRWCSLLSLEPDFVRKIAREIASGKIDVNRRWRTTARSGIATGASCDSPCARPPRARGRNRSHVARAPRRGVCEAGCGYVGSTEHDPLSGGNEPHGDRGGTEYLGNVKPAAREMGWVLLHAFSALG